MTRAAVSIGKIVKIKSIFNSTHTTRESRQQSRMESEIIFVTKLMRSGSDSTN